MLGVGRGGGEGFAGGQPGRAHRLLRAGDGHQRPFDSVYQRPRTSLRKEVVKTPPPARMASTGERDAGVPIPCDEIACGASIPSIVERARWKTGDVVPLDSEQRALRPSSE